MGFAAILRVYLPPHVDTCCRLLDLLDSKLFSPLSLLFSFQYIKFYTNQVYIMYDFVPPTTLGSRGNPFPPNKNSTTARKFYGWFTWKSAGKGDEPNLDFPSFSASMFTKNPDPSRSIRIDGRNIPSLEYDCRGSPKKDIPGSLGVKLWGVYSIPSLPNTWWVGVWVSPAKAFRGSKHLLTETNSSPLKMDDWNTIVSFWDGLFSGAFC